jgi:hypothetical protein
LQSLDRRRFAGGFTQHGDPYMPIAMAVILSCRFRPPAIAKREHQAVLGANRMSAAPTKQSTAPLKSQASGRCFSTAQSQTSDAAM